jgi:hypothetical protein
MRGGVVDGAIGREERLGLARGEGVLLDGIGESALLARAEGRQKTRQRQRQPTAVDA